jgi:hypothetical protein
VPVSVARFAKHAGATPWCGAASAALGYGFAFHWGLVGQVMALPLTMFLLPVLDRHATEPRARSLALSCGVMALLYFTHESAMVVACAAVVVLAASHPPSWKKTALRLAPLACGAGLALAQLAYQSRDTAVAISTSKTMWMETSQRIDYLPRSLVGLWPDTTRDVLFACTAVMMLVLLAERVVRALRAPREPMTFFARAHALRFDVLALAVLCAYFVAPFAWKGAVWIHARFLGPAALLVFVAVAPRTLPILPARVLAAAQAIVAIVLLHPRFVEIGDQHRSFERLAAHIEPASAIATVDGGRTYRRPNMAIEGIVARATTWRGGRVGYSFIASSAIPPVRIARAAQWNEPIERMLDRELWLHPSWDLRRFRYVVVWAVADVSVDLFTQALAPEARFVAREDHWVLFESTLPLAPLTAPDEPAKLDGETLLARILRVTPEVLEARKAR